ncbi:MAG: glycerol-3-phosphate dehydrogenase/oxidase [Actinomycetota bacterium]|nr:glycerol-3-phosphate dehydrogenase/oxidase [Actinomycetota bacterium]
MALREANLDKLDNGDFDVLIVGGGINGAVSAAALASRGATVALIDRGDFAGFTSQQSSNLVWGGIKYLENYEIPLVRKLCLSRNRLMRAYPANVKEIGFLGVLGETSPFPPWLVGVGAFAYWGIGNFKTNAPRPMSAETIERVEPVVNTIGTLGGIEYADAYLKDNDARFVFSFIRSAMDVGAIAANYVELTSAERVKGKWFANLRDVESGSEFSLQAKVIVNAAGPFLDGLNQSWNLHTRHQIVYSKGVHLIVDQLTPNERVLAFFDDSQRLFYVIPMGNRSVIGTTDTRVTDPHTVVTDEDRDFLLGQINDRLDLSTPLNAGDIISERSGVRPLVVRRQSRSIKNVDWTALSRKHEVEIDHAKQVVSIFGGKLTDCLNVGEEVADAVQILGIHLNPDHRRWYGEPGRESRKAFFRQTRGMRIDDLRDNVGSEPISERLWRRYGRRAFDMLDDIREDPSMADDILDSSDYLRVELHNTASTEMVVKLDDFLRRRSKISLITRDEDVRSSEGLHEVAKILFGSSAEAKLAEHFGSSFVTGESGN